ncbi:hypothetical protein, partial [Micromonospora aurantiaca (nom. illeg.)]|uniref:hypothetical protein n=1 Tax=Micromonospora aurantiaca (nom. illeg.) TaxID=47850 RepID=UPI003822156D
MRAFGGDRQRGYLTALLRIYVRKPTISEISPWRTVTSVAFEIDGHAAECHHAASVLFPPPRASSASSRPAGGRAAGG